MRWRTRPMEDAYAFCNRIPATFLLVSTDGYLAGFTAEEVTGQNQVKASVQRKIRQSIADEYHDLEPLLEDMLPKKAPLIVAKCQNHINLVVVNNLPLFFNVWDGPYMPTLRLLHQCANIMCPGLTSADAALDKEVPADVPVAIMAEGKQHALAIGLSTL